MTIRNNPRRGIREETSQPPRYFFSAIPTTTDKKDKRTNKYYEVGSFGIIGQDPISGIDVISGTEGDLYYLTKFDTNGDALWVLLGASAGDILALRDQDNAVVSPDASGYVDVDGAVVANGANPLLNPLETVKSSTTLLVQQQLATTVTPTPVDTASVGLSSYNVNQFQFDATSGMASLKGDTTNQAVQTVNVNFLTGPGVNPVVASAAGLVQIWGNTVTNATNANSPVATHTRAVNQFHVDVQISTALAATPADPFDVGLASFDNRYFSVDGNGFTEIEDRLLQFPIGTTINLGISYSSPTFTIHDSVGGALSATNPAWVVLPDNTTKGHKKVFEVTSNYSFDDDSGTSDITGNTFGTTTTVAWGQNMPFWIYFVVSDDNTAITPMISRNHGSNVSPGTIGKPSSAIADTEGSFWALDDLITVGDYDSNPCVRVGTYLMQKNDAANDDWTVQALTDRDGIGKDNFGVNFVFAIAQNGASGRYLSSSVGGDTLPTFAMDAYLYHFLPNGWVHISYTTTNVDNTPLGAGSLRLHLPFNMSENAWKNNMAGFSFDDASLANGTVCGSCYATQNTSYIFVREFQPFGTVCAFITPGTLANADGNFSWNFMYRAFNE